MRHTCVVKRLHSCFFVLACLSVAQVTPAAPTLRQQVNQRGDFLLVGNTLGQDCDGGTPAPVVGTVSCAGSSNNGDSAPDLFWRSQSPAAGQAQANTSIGITEARSTSVLTLPPGATVTYARLYWAAESPTGAADTAVTFDRPGGFSQAITADQSFTIGSENAYQSTADVTTLVAAQGNGAYRISGVNSKGFVNTNDNVNFAAWWMVVFYEDFTQAPRNLALFDGLDLVNNGTTQNATLSGFLVPNAGFTAKLGVITYEGDNQASGDSLLFGPSAPLNNGDRLSDGANPITNFFNSTRSNLGTPLTVVGDLPQLTGGAQSMGSFDMDIVDITSRVSAGQTSAAIQANSSGDVYFLGAFVTSISTFRPDFTGSEKTVVDVNGGTTVPGDVLEYTINVVNNGNDTSVNTILADALPVGVTYVPNSIAITSGPNTGAKTDPADADQAEYNAGTRVITVRLGTGANGTQGGTMPIGGMTTVRFRVTVNTGASGVINNQASITGSGLLGAPSNNWPTDGNGSGSGSPPTPINVECTNNTHCPASAPICFTTPNPNKCVQCISNANCSGTTPVCNTTTNVCAPCANDTQCSGATPACQASGACGQCSATNATQCSGATPVCKASSGTCVACTTNAQCSGLTPTCNTTTNTCSCVATGPEVCGNAIDEDCDGSLTNGCVDTDGDGLDDDTEIKLGTDPNDADSDDDGLLDGMEVQPGVDTDGDGLINALDPDSDDDGLFDGTETGKDCSNAATNPAAGACVADGDAGATVTNPLNPDTDGGGASDGSEDANLNGVVDSGETDPSSGKQADDATVTDTDKDGLSDALEAFLGSNPNDADSDDDGLLDGDEHNPSHDTDGEGLINVLDVDSDNDALFDGTEDGKDCSNAATNTELGHCIADGDKGATKTSPLLADTDAGGVRDGSEDANRDGVKDATETNPVKGQGADDGTVVDTDGDGLSDALEISIGTDPNDADSDDDGVPDGEEPNPSDDHDGDGLINALDPDSDDDGLFDGTEMGKGCSDPATDPKAKACIPDSDQGQTKTNPLDADTDGGGATDGSEDANRNGVVDAGETNPVKGQGADDSGVIDSDGDGLSDALENSLGSSPTDADTDDDGLLDGEEHNPGHDTDGDGLINLLDVDSDNDAIYDGTEAGQNCDNAATDTTKNHCIADGDSGATTTFVLNPDTDRGGVRDGSEDANRNGVVDAGETDPTRGNGADDASVVDTDGDGLSDALEDSIGTNKNDADSDDDGLLDGDEPNPSDDHDGDGKINPMDEDADDDGLFDGTEAGRNCSNAATDISKNLCKADADAGATTTGVLNPDTDGGGVKDGVEDANKDGAVDPGETDPNDPIDDGCTADDQCGGADDGQVCDTDTNKCVSGCRGVGPGAGCPSGQVCSSTDTSIGTCEPTGSGGAGGGAGSGGLTGTGGAAAAPEGLALEGGGCSCSTPRNSNTPIAWALAALAAAALGFGRRRSRGRSR